ncbi:VIT1/CCC1 transporter family protein [Listeria aquatica]
MQAQEVLGFKLNDYANPFSAALSSLFSFSVGAILPLLTITLFQLPFESGLHLLLC